MFGKKNKQINYKTHL